MNHTGQLASQLGVFNSGASLGGKVPVIPVIEAVAVIVVTPVFFLMPVVLRRSGVTHGQRHCKGCHKKNRTEKVSISTAHACGEYAVITLEEMFDKGH